MGMGNCSEPVRCEGSLPWGEIARCYSFCCQVIAQRYASAAAGWKCHQCTAVCRCGRTQHCLGQNALDDYVGMDLMAQRQFYFFAFGEKHCRTVSWLVGGLALLARCGQLTRLTGHSSFGGPLALRGWTWVCCWIDTEKARKFTEVDLPLPLLSRVQV